MSRSSHKRTIKSQDIEREKDGCSIMSYAWTRKKTRTLINFLVSCQSSHIFVKSVDASSYVKTREIEL